MLGVVIIMYEYANQKELFTNLIPALNVKLRLLKNSNYNDITREDIWNYLKVTKWRYDIDLALSDMVEDIIHIDNLDIVSYYKKNRK